MMTTTTSENTSLAEQLAAEQLAGPSPKKRGKFLHDQRKRPDHLSTLPVEILCRITAFLDAPSLCQCAMVNRMYRDVANTNHAGWTHLCQLLWNDKIHVPQQFRNHPHAKQAYRDSQRDAQQRQHIRPEELIYDEQTHTGTIWSFRFKESAGRDWTVVDPWYNGQPCRKMVLLRDGRVQQYCHERKLSSYLEFGNQLADPPLPMLWRFLTRPMDLPARPHGSYIRFSVAGRDVPTYAVRRSPTGNWGFVMESCWGLYASFELPPRKIPRRRLRRTEEGVMLWVDEEPSQHLQDDSSLMVTNEIQWREAFLYNVGARVLPEGDEAMVEFDRAWGGLGT